MSAAGFAPAPKAAVPTLARREHERERERERWAGRKGAELSAAQLVQARAAGYEPGDDGYMVGRDPRAMTAAELVAIGHEPMPPLVAIRAKCLDCCAGSAHEVRLCVAKTCPSWPFRTGKNPWRAPASEAQREAARRMAACQSEAWSLRASDDEAVRGATTTCRRRMMNGMRRIEQRHPTTGHVIGVFQTTLTDAELAERDRQTAGRREALLARGLSVTSEERRREQAEREALAGVGVTPDARDDLRAAHKALAAARDELARRREVAAAAEAHVGRCEAAAVAARQVVDRIACRAAAAIVEQLEKGEAPAGPTPTRAAAEKAEAARAELEHAIAAKNEVAVAVARAERAIVEAEARIKEAAAGVIRLRVSELRSEIDGLNERLKERCGQLNSLMPTLHERRWEVPWPAAAVALLADPEAALDRNE
jgi:hypothetical protein